MTPKLEFLQAVARMSPGEPFICRVAELVPDNLLPPITGVAAFELVATLDTLCKSWRFRRPLRTFQSPRRTEQSRIIRAGQTRPIGRTRQTEC